MFLLSFRLSMVLDGRVAGQPFSSLFTRRVSLAATTVRPSSRRVRVDGLCSNKCRRLAFWRTIFPVPVRRNRFEAPLWVLALGVFPLLLGFCSRGQVSWSTGSRRRRHRNPAPRPPGLRDGAPWRESSRRGAVPAPSSCC